MKLKYVILDDCFPILFTEAKTHGDVVGCLGKGRVTSAGFCSIRPDRDDVTVSCWGESVSLKKESNPEYDETVIAKMFKPEY